MLVALDAAFAPCVDDCVAPHASPVSDADLVDEIVLVVRRAADGAHLGAARGTCLAFGARCVIEKMARGAGPVARLGAVRRLLDLCHVCLLYTSPSPRDFG